MLYRILRAIVGLGIRCYYREIRIVNRKELEVNGPVILIANHPNTLMDAWMMGFINKRRVHFMAKATFFNSPLKRKLLASLGMIPINRKSDSAVEGVSNKDSFEACYQLLEKGEILVVFPEGTSYLERKLRDLKSGTARIALEVERRNEGRLKLKVIPVGLNYIDGDSFRGKVMAHVGKPIPLSDLLPEYQLNQGKAAKQLTERFRTELSRVFVSMDTAVKEGLGEQLTMIFQTKYAERSGGVDAEIQFLKTVNERLDAFTVTAPWKLAEIQQASSVLLTSFQIAGVRPDFLDRPYRTGLYFRQVTQSLLFLILTVPLFLFGFLHSFLPYFIIGKLVPKLSKELEYHAPLTVLLGLVMYPVTYMCAYFLFKQMTDVVWWIAIVYVISLPFAGMFAHFFMRYVKHIYTKQRFSRLAQRRSAVVDGLKAQRSVLKDLIFQD